MIKFVPMLRSNIFLHHRSLKKKSRKHACDFLCSKRDSNPHRRFCPRDFKSLASRHSSSISETLYIFVNQPFISPQGRNFPVKNQSRFTSRFTHKVQNNVIVNRIGLYHTHKISKTFLTTNQNCLSIYIILLGSTLFILIYSLDNPNAKFIKSI